MRTSMNLRGAAAALCLALAGAADMVSGVFRSTVWSQTIPEAMRGRLAGIEMLSYSLGPLGGQVRAGLTADLWSVRGAISSGGFACVVGVGATALWLRDFWRYDARTDERPLPSDPFPPPFRWSAQDADVERAVGAAREAFDNGPWPKLTHAQRAEYLRAISDAVRERTDDVIQVWPRESGILAGVAQGMMSGIPDAYAYYANLAESYRWETPETPTAGGNYGMIVREPVGVVGAIIPWNAPMTLIAYKLAPALLAGCTVVLKASPEAPGAPLIMAEIAEKVGLPEGVLNVLTADREVSETLVRDPRVDKIAFTGSTAAGKKIGAIMAERVGRYSLELGGKSANIVLDDADLTQAVKLGLGNCFINGGQTCTAWTRLLVPQSLHDQVVEMAVVQAAKYTVGDPTDESTRIGPMSSERQRQRVEEYIATGVSEGAELAVGGPGRPDGLSSGAYVRPTIFSGVRPDATIAQEEIFGPVLSVMPYGDEDEAVEIANATVYGLAGAVFAGSQERGLEVAKRMRTGQVDVNGGAFNPLAPFGGYKQSGTGRELGRYGLEEFLEVKSIQL